jgi:hypothetical protein
MPSASQKEFMSLDIDMENFGRQQEPAAVVQQEAGFNSYNQEEGEYVHKEFLEPPTEVIQEGLPIEEKVPVPPTNPQADNFRALREEVDRLKTEREQEKREHQLQMDIWKANQTQRQPGPQRKEMFDGMREDDIPNVGELRREWQQRESEYQSRLEELHVQQMHPDYEEVIEKYAIPLVKQKPHLAEGLRGATNKALFAYELGAMAKQMQQVAQAPVETIAQPTSRIAEAERMIANSKKPGTLSQAGGQASLSKADYFATMSDQEFMQLASKNLEGI